MTHKIVHAHTRKKGFQASPLAFQTERFYKVFMSVFVTKKVIRRNFFFIRFYPISTAFVKSVFRQPTNLSDYSKTACSLKPQSFIVKSILL